MALYYKGLEKVILSDDTLKLDNIISDLDDVQINNNTIRNVKRDNLLGKYIGEKSSSNFGLNEFIKKISCKCCSKALINDVKAIQLPSTGWMDLLDCWSCHQDEFAVVTGNLIHGVSIDVDTLTTSASTNSYILPPKGYIFYQYNSIIIGKEDFIGEECCFKTKKLKDVKSLDEYTHFEIHRSFLLFDDEGRDIDCFQFLIMDILESLSVHNQRVFEIGKFLISIISKDLLMLGVADECWSNSILFKIEKNNNDGNDFKSSWTNEMFSVFMEKIMIGKEIARLFYPEVNGDGGGGELSLIQIK